LGEPEGGQQEQGADFPLRAGASDWNVFLWLAAVP